MSAFIEITRKARYFLKGNDPTPKPSSRRRELKNEIQLEIKEKYPSHVTKLAADGQFAAFSWTDALRINAHCFIKDEILLLNQDLYTFGHVKQLNLIKPQKSDHGGRLRNKREGRGMRQISTNSTMHFVLRSKNAKGKWRFQATRRIWLPILKKFANRYGVTILSHADPGNHIHLHLKFSNRSAYKPFIRGLTASIAMAITGVSRWKKVDLKFWDLRPFSRVVIGRKAFRFVVDYIHLNQLEALGHSREVARVGVRNFRANTG